MNIVVDGSNAFVATGGCAFDPKKTNSSIYSWKWSGS
jgi:hypothetical protein